MALGEAIFKIRFCSMKFEEFAPISKNYSGLLSAQESIEIFHVIGMKANGEQSSTFGDDNSKKRKPIQSCLECSFAKGERIPYDSKRNIDFVTFLTNKAIELIGFVICNRIDDNIGVSFYELQSETDWNSIKSTVSKLENETKIIFDKPIHIVANGDCYIRIESNAFGRPGLYGFNTESSITQNDILFTFSRNTKVNLITRLLFNIDEEF